MIHRITNLFKKNPVMNNSYSNPFVNTEVVYGDPQVAKEMEPDKQILSERVHYKKVLDLTDPLNLKVLSLSEEVLYSEDKTALNMIIHIMKKKGWDAIKMYQNMSKKSHVFIEIK